MYVYVYIYIYIHYVTRMPVENAEMDSRRNARLGTPMQAVPSTLPHRPRSCQSVQPEKSGNQGTKKPRNLKLGNQGGPKLEV